MNKVLLPKKSMTGRSFTFSFRLRRLLWVFVNVCFFRMSPKPFFKYRNFILRMFGGNVAKTARVNPSANIWYPSNLSLGENSAIGFNVILYNQGRIDIGDNVIVSQYSYLCASTHDYDDPLHPLILAPIEVSNNVWVCAGSFIGPGVSVGEGAVVGARCVLSKDASPWSVYAGNPAKKIKDRSFDK